MNSTVDQTLPLNVALQQAIAHHQAGRLQEAEQLYRAILQVQPSQPDANHNLGVLAIQVQQPAAALPHFKAALDANPEQVHYWVSYIDALIRANQLDAAGSVLEQGLRRGLNGEAVDALILRIAEGKNALPTEFTKPGETTRETALQSGKIRSQQGQQNSVQEKTLTTAEINQLAALFNGGNYVESESRASALALQHPNSGFVWKVLGASLHIQGKDALYALQMATKLLPNDAVAHYNLGNALKRHGQLDDAVANYRKALSSNPDFAEAHCNLGNTLRGLGCLDDAVASYRRALELKPDFADAHSNLGTSFRELSRLDDAVISYRRALEINPDFAEGHANLSAVLSDVGNLDDAVVSARRALQIKPDYAEAHFNLGNALRDRGQLDEALASYGRALQIKPKYVDAYNNLLLAHNLLPDQPVAMLLAEAQRFGDLVARQANPYSDWRNVPESERCLRVGLVSGDLRNHPVGYFVESVLAALASNAVDRLNCIVYSNLFSTDALTERLKSYCHRWHSIVGLSDENLAQQIREDGIDILIDLSGHTGHNRLPMFAWKPAPVQASWLGYFATTGVAAMDYLIADPWTAPRSEEGHFTEKIQRLPETYLCFTAPDVDVQVASLPALAAGHLTFGCFNNLTKMNDAVVALWARVLNGVPNSRLFLKTKQLNLAAAQQTTIERFAIHGIDATRLILEGQSPRSELLAAYQRVDIALDPFPFPGGTTSVEALWMGVPVLTLAGDRFLSHIGESIMQNASLPDWIAVDADDYLERAVVHAGNLQRLATLRNELRQRVLASPLFDAPRFARHFEAALRHMWAQWCSQQNGAQAETLTPVEISQLVALFNGGRYAELENGARTGTVQHSNSGFAWKILGASLQMQGKDALHALQMATKLLPGDPETHNNLGSALIDLGKLDDAVASCRRAVEVKPDFAEAHNNLGIALKEIGLYDDAVASYRWALHIKPDYAEGHNNLGNVLLACGQLNEAEVSFRRALQIKPDYTDAYSNLLFAYNYQTARPSSISLEEAQRFGNLVARQALPKVGSSNVPEPDRCLRVGLVSGDLHNHPVGFFVENVLEAFATGAAGRLEIVAYCCQFHTDALTERIKALCHDWRSAVGLSDESLAQRIRDDGIDILIDLSGHTGHNRLPMFAWKPAPVQASWLGYFATTGVAAMDYLIADPWTAPLAEEGHFTEKILRLPETYLCFTPPDVDVQVAILPVLAAGHITFGCFNNLTKMNDAVVALWARVLRAVPESRLFLKTHRLNLAEAQQTTNERFAAHGIDPKRLILEGHSPRSELLAAYQRVDIALDPFPFPGGTTSVEALWMGVPVLTLAGNRFLSHIGESIMQNAGLPDWIAVDADDYVARAVSHTGNLQRLATLHNGLRQQVLASPLFDAPRFARHFEAALRDMWTRWCKQQHGAQAETLTLDEISQLVSLFNVGRYAELENRARSLIAQHPNSGFAWKILGASLQVQGKDALHALQMATQLLSDDPEAHSNLGRALVDLGHLDDAVTSCRHAVEIKPDLAAAHNNLGNALRGLGRFGDAAASFGRALELKPDYAEAHCNLGNALRDIRHIDDAVASYRRALELKPDFAEAHNNLGNALADLGHLDDAVLSFRRALQLKPDFADAHSNLGNALSDIGKHDDAIVCYHRALQIKPDYAEAHFNLGNALRDLGYLDDAVASYRRTLQIKPDFTDAHSNLLFVNHYRAQPVTILLAEAKRFGDLVARKASPYSDWPNAPEFGRCLRIGLVSGDFRKHPVGYFVEGVLAALASNALNRIALIAYSSHFRADALTERIKALCHEWHSAVGRSDESLAQRVRDDGIDILIDLSGHTGHNRLPMFAWKPAPVQASWLGYFATTGVAAMDYLIADPWTAPRSEEGHFTEKIQRLPETYLCFTAPDVDVQVASLPALAAGHLTFGCFNNLTKMNDAVVALWARVLNGVPNSRLFLKTKQLNLAAAQQTTIERFAIHGIDATRLILEGQSPRSELLAAYQRVDIALDPFPFPGGTTSVEALWMGVPVLALTGDRFLSHIGESIMHNAGLPDWIATDADAYVAMAVAHAGDLQGLARLRDGLRQRVLASPLFDAPRFARHFEAALRDMWTQWCNQHPGRPS